jgi:hypothetical protein
MKSNFVLALGTAAAALLSAPAAFAVVPSPSPAPLLGAGLPGLAILAAAGGGYLALRLNRRGRD